MLENIFQEIGLSKYETKVYIALLELGESTSGEILKKANIQTGKIYLILDSLKSKGFVSEIIKNKVKKFSPTEVDEILELFEKKREKINEEETLFKKILPEINSKINNKKEKIHFEIYTGFNGMKKAFAKEMKKYNSSKTLMINGIIDYNKHPKKFVDYFKYNVFSQREISKVKIKKIIDKNAINNVHEKNAQILTLNYSSIMTVNTIDNLVILSVWILEPIFLTIESEDVAKGFKENFENLCLIANKL